MSGTNILNVENEKTILSASKIVWAEGCAPVRVVYRKNGGEYITHMENLRLDDGIFKHDGFYWGHYFGEDANKAHADYVERCKKL